MLAIPVAKLLLMDLGIKFLWLADDEWIWEGHKLPCEFNDFSKIVFITSVQGFFHFLEGIITTNFTGYLKDKVPGSITGTTTTYKCLQCT